MFGFEGGDGVLLEEDGDDIVLAGVFVSEGGDGAGENFLCLFGGDKEWMYGQSFDLGDLTFELGDLGRLEWWSSTGVLLGDLTFGLGDLGLE